MKQQKISNRWVQYQNKCWHIFSRRFGYTAHDNYMWQDAIDVLHITIYHCEVPITIGNDIIVMLINNIYLLQMRWTSQHSCRCPLTHIAWEKSDQQTTWVMALIGFMLVDIGPGSAENRDVVFHHELWYFGMREILCNSQWSSLILDQSFTLQSFCHLPTIDLMKCRNVRWNCHDVHGI